MLSKLQKEFYDLVKKDLETGLIEFVPGVTLESFLEDLEKDISGMNAAELRHNIKVWKETQ